MNKNLILYCMLTWCKRKMSAAHGDISDRHVSHSVCGVRVCVRARVCVSKEKVPY